MALRITITDDADDAEVYSRSVVELDEYRSPAERMTQVECTDDDGEKCTLGELLVGAARYFADERRRREGE